MITRRALFGFLAAPAIVPVASLMVDGQRCGDFIRLGRAA